MARKKQRGGRQKGTGVHTAQLVIQMPPALKEKMKDRAWDLNLTLAAFCRDAIERALAARG